MIKTVPEPDSDSAFVLGEGMVKISRGIFCDGGQVVGVRREGDTVFDGDRILLGIGDECDSDGCTERGSSGGFGHTSYRFEIWCTFGSFSEWRDLSGVADDCAAAGVAGVEV